MISIERAEREGGRVVAVRLSLSLPAALSS